MTPKERQLAAIRREIPDRIPVDAIAIENLPEIAGRLGVPVEDAAAALGLDGRGVAAAYSGDPPRVPTGEPATEWGTVTVLDYGTAHWYPLAAADSIAKVESYGWPEAEQYDYAQARELAATVSPTYAVRGPYWRPIFAQACEMLGIERMLGVMMDEPARAEAIFRCVHAVQRAYCERFVAACGEHLDVFYLGDDFATQNGLMMPPDLWRQFLMPLYADLFSIGKQAGKYVWFHSCGDITEVLGDLIDIGMDLWETVQLHALPMPARELKREYGGAVAFFGGVSTQHIPFDTPERVRERTVAAIEALGAGGGYICGPDHHVKPDVPPANAVALFEAARSFRGEGYTLDS